MKTSFKTQRALLLQDVETDKPIAIIICEVGENKDITNKVITALAEDLNSIPVSIEEITLLHNQWEWEFTAVFTYEHDEHDSFTTRYKLGFITTY